MQTLIVLGIVGFFAQLVDGALGMAYGTTSTTLALAVGLSPAVASATVHMAELGTCVASGCVALEVRKRGLAHRPANRDPGRDRRIHRRRGTQLDLGRGGEAVDGDDPRGLGVYILVRFALGRAPRPRGRPYVRGRYLAGLGLFGGFIDASGGGGWGPVATPTLLATGKIEPRKVIGSVDTSEFLVALAASIGFLLALGSQGISWQFLGALLVGGILAAPIAAWLVRLLSPRVLGASVGGFIVITNARTLLDAAGVPGEGVWRSTPFWSRSGSPRSHSSSGRTAATACR